MARDEDVARSYDAVAAEYVERFENELDHKPFDREILDRFAEALRQEGVVCDLGCGPGQIARYLHGRGVDMCGIDLSAEMIEQARRLNPGLSFEVGDMLALSAADSGWAGISAFYSIIHVPPTSLARALGEMHRTLRPGGLLLLAFHSRDRANPERAVAHLDEWWDKKVSVDFFFHARDTMQAALREARLAVEEVLERAPYPDVEAQTDRTYIFARKAS